MAYNEWGDQDPKKELLKNMYRAISSGSEYAYVDYMEAKEKYDALTEYEGMQGGS